MQPGRGGIQPCHVGSLPHQLAALNMGNIGLQQLTVDAALTGSRGGHLSGGHAGSLYGVGADD